MTKYKLELSNEKYISLDFVFEDMWALSDFVDKAMRHSEVPVSATITTVRVEEVNADDK